MKYIYMVVYDAEKLGRTQVESNVKVNGIEDIKQLEKKLENLLDLRDVAILYFRLLTVDAAEHLS